MIDAQQSKHGRIKVTHVDRILHYVVTKIVSLSVDDARFSAPACHPHREATRMMIPSVVLLGKTALAVYRPSEFPAPHNQGVIQKPAAPQIRDQRVRSAIRRRAKFGQVADGIRVHIPSALIYLRKADAALGHAP